MCIVLQQFRKISVRMYSIESVQIQDLTFYENVVHVVLQAFLRFHSLLDFASCPESLGSIN